MASSVFELQIAKFVEKANGNVNLVVRKVAFEVFSGCIQKSPVDTGRFKSNWLVAINSIPTGTVGFAKDDEREKTGRKTQGRSDFVGGPTITKVETVTLGAKAGDVIYLVNNLEYARALEYGHSQQAPAGMVRLSIEEFNSVVTQTVNQLPK